MIRILVGDCRRLLRSIAADSVQTVVTSPPYYGLRDWGTDGEVWGGDPACAHAWGEDVVSPRKSGGDGSTSTLGTASGGNAISQAGILRSIDRSKHQGARSNFCRHCGAWRGTLGLEPDYRMFIDNLVEVFREVRRVLRPDGTVFLNLGDSYFAGGRGGGGSFASERRGWRALPYGTSGTELSGSPANGSSSRNLCDGCRAALFDGRTSHNARSLVCERTPLPSASSQDHTGSPLDRLATSGSDRHGDHNAGATLGQPQRPRPSPELFAGALASTSRESSERHPVACCHCDNCGACLSVLRSSTRDARLCAHRGGVPSLPAIGALASLGQDGCTPDISSTDGASVLRRRDMPFGSGSLKQKDLVGMPWMVALALRDDGWYLRQDIVWAKQNAMPESITDRCTKSHEYVFLLTKTRHYYFDNVAIMEMSSENTRPRTGKNSYLNEDHVPRTRKNDATNGSHMPGAAPHTGIHRAGKPRGGQLVGVNPKALWDGVGPKPKQNASYSAAISAVQLVEMRNKRDVWTIATEPFKDAHFATMPSALVEPCILAATSDRGACPTCGAGWRRVTRKVPSGRKQKMADGWDTGEGGHGTIHRGGREAGEPDHEVMVTETVGWYPACGCYGVDKLPRYPDRPKDRPAIVRWRAACEAVYRAHLDLIQKALPLPTRPCVVLDPFFGAGTVGLVADRLQRDAIGMDLNPTYAEMAHQRIVGDEIGPLLPTTVEVQHDPINNDPR